MPAQTSPASYIHIVPAQQNELLASWVLNIAARSGRPFSSFIAEHASGVRRPCADTGNLEFLLKWNAIELGSEEAVLRQHSLLEFRRPFYTSQEWQQIRAVGYKPACRAHPRGNDGIRICPECFTAKGREGSYAWTRDPQIGLRYCTCGAPLVETNLTLGVHDQPPGAADLNGAVSLAVEDRRYAKHHVTLSRDVSAALNLSLPHLGHQGWRNCYTKILSLCGDKSLVAGSRQKPSRILERINDHFGADFIPQLQLDRRTEQLRAHKLFSSAANGIMIMAVVARACGTSLVNALADAGNT